MSRSAPTTYQKRHHYGDVVMVSRGQHKHRLGIVLDAQTVLGSRPGRNTQRVSVRFVDSFEPLGFGGGTLIQVIGVSNSKSHSFATMDSEQLKGLILSGLVKYHYLYERESWRVLGARV